MNSIKFLIFSLLSFSVFSHAEEGFVHLLTDPHHGSPLLLISVAVLAIAGIAIYKNKSK